MRKLVLFDIDGTLVLTGRAGVRAMTAALRDVFGDSSGLDGIPVAGRTDWAILADAVMRHGYELDDRLLDDLRRRYVENLARQIEHRGEGPKGVMPGVREVLDALAVRDEVFLGLLTGNFLEGARIKLGHFDLWRYFRCGAFGDDASDRNLLVPVACDRARALGYGSSEARDVYVIGDTPADVSCAQAAGAVAIGVATGPCSIEQLREAGADYVFEDLADTRAFLRLVRS